MRIFRGCACAADCAEVAADAPSHDTTVTFGEVEIRRYGQGNAEEIVSYPLPDVRLVHRRTANAAPTPIPPSTSSPTSSAPSAS